MDSYTDLNAAQPGWLSRCMSRALSVELAGVENEAVQATRINSLLPPQTQESIEPD